MALHLPFAAAQVDMMPRLIAPTRTLSLLGKPFSGAGPWAFRAEYDMREIWPPRSASW